jgi:hypothetical protein
VINETTERTFSGFAINRAKAPSQWQDRYTVTRRPRLFNCQRFLILPIESRPTNPFSTSRIAPSQVAYHFPVSETEADVDKLERLLAKIRQSPRSVIVGPHGTGKSTLLQTLLPRLQQIFPAVVFIQLCGDPSVGHPKQLIERYRRARQIRRALHQPVQQGLLVVDGWEQLPKLSQLQLAWSASIRKQTLLATSHRNLRGWSLLHQTKPTQDVILSLADNLLHGVSDDIFTLVIDDLKNRNVTPTTNVRDLWFEMYDKVEDAQTPSLKFSG